MFFKLKEFSVLFEKELLFLLFILPTLDRCKFLLISVIFPAILSKESIFLSGFLTDLIMTLSFYFPYFFVYFNLIRKGALFMGILLISENFPVILSKEPIFLHWSFTDSIMIL